MDTELNHMVVAAMVAGIIFSWCVVFMLGYDCGRNRK